MTNSEKILALKRLFVAANTLCANTHQLISQSMLNEQDVDKAINYMDEMIALLPVSFPAGALLSTSEPALLINLNNSEDEPKQTMVKHDGGTQYVIPEHTYVLYEESLQIVLEDWKFLHWNYVTVEASEKSSRDKYKPLMLAQAEKCLAFFPDKENWRGWELNMVVVYANQIGYYAFKDEQDVVKLERALNILERGFKLSNWRDHKFIKHTMVSLLLKLGRQSAAYPIVAEALEKNAGDPDYHDLLQDEHYISWAAAKTQQKEEAHNEYLRSVIEEQARVTDHFINPNDPLVKQYAGTLNVIKQRMTAIRMRKIHAKVQKNEEVTDDYIERFKLRTWSVQELEAFEETSGLRLPGEYKVYLMEIGSGGGAGYFIMCEIEGVDILDAAEIDRMKKPFPITPDKIHDVGSFYGVKAWVYPDSEKWKATGLDMQVLFGLPENSSITDGCMLMAYSKGQNELYLVANGAFEGEVWVDLRGCFGAASSQRLTFLAFIAESLQATWMRTKGPSNEGDWM